MIYKEKYEIPTTEVVEVKMESGLLQGGSPSAVSATRSGYGTAETADWD